MKPYETAPNTQESKYMIELLMVYALLIVLFPFCQWLYFWYRVWYHHHTYSARSAQQEAKRILNSRYPWLDF